MTHVVITGGSRGIGSGLVEAFALRKCKVTFTGTSDLSIRSAYESFDNNLDPARVKGVVCDVRKLADIEMLWDFATKLNGKIDIWINNAGVTNSEQKAGLIDPLESENVIDVNIKGLLACCKIAYEKMSKQGSGAIYNMGGLGSDGRMVEGLAPYGMSKRAVQYYTKAFAKEIQGEDVTMSLLLPGMVVTDMLLDPIRKDPEGSKKARRIFNILAEEVETVAEFLVEQILTNDKNGAVISYLTPFKAFSRFITRPLSGRDVISDKL